MIERIELDYAAATPAGRMAMMMGLRGLFGGLDSRDFPAQATITVQDGVAQARMFVRINGRIRIRRDSGKEPEPSMLTVVNPVTAANLPDLVMLRAVAA